MTPKEFDQLVEATISDLKKLIQVKGGEYAEQTERFENFIRNGKRLDLHRLVIWAVYFNKHVDAINSYVAGVQSGKIRESSEPIQGRFKDALVYLLLGLGMVEETFTLDTPLSYETLPLYEKPDGWYFIEKEGDQWRRYPTGWPLPRIHVGIKDESLIIPERLINSEHDYYVILEEKEQRKTLIAHGFTYKSGQNLSMFYRVKHTWLDQRALTSKP